MQDDEEELLRSVAMQNAKSILLARQRAERELLLAKEELERKTQELAGSLAMMRATLESTWDGILVTDAHGHVTDFNQRYVDMWRIPQQIMETKEHRRILEHTCRQFEDGRPFLARIDEIHSAAGGRAWTSWSSRTVECSSGSPGSVSSMARTSVACGAFATSPRLAARKTSGGSSWRASGSPRAEAERASAMKDEFLATLSHELRTPLSAILGWAYILRSRRMSEAELHEGLKVIERNARMQTELIEDLLDMSRITSGKMRLDVQPVEPVTLHRGRARDGTARGRGEGHPARASCSTPRPDPSWAIRAGSSRSCGTCCPMRSSSRDQGDAFRSCWSG